MRSFEWWVRFWFTIYLITGFMISYEVSVFRLVLVHKPTGARWHDLVGSGKLFQFWYSILTVGWIGLLFIPVLLPVWELQYHEEPVE